MGRETALFEAYRAYAQVGLIATERRRRILHIRKTQEAEVLLEILRTRLLG